MNLTAHRDSAVGIDVVFSRTFENLLKVWRQLLVYSVGVIVLAIIAPFLGGGPGGLATFWLGWGAYFAGQYWLYRELMAARGLLETSKVRFFSFCGLAIVLIVPIMAGVTFFLWPGILLAARWVAAPAFIVGRGEGVFAAAGRSWQISRGNSLALSATFLLLFILWLMLGAVFGGLDTTIEDFWSLDEKSPVEAFEFHILPILLLGMSVATYELLGQEGMSIDDVFT